jgi:hypothetical protein
VTTPTLVVIFAVLVMLTIMHRTLFAFLLTIGVGFALLVTAFPAKPDPIPVVAERVSEIEQTPLIVVPEPDPASVGILLDRTARADAPLTPLVP